MSKEDIIRMAREAADPELADPFQNGFCVLTQEELERFFTQAQAHEREACAKVCETLGVHPALNVYRGGPEWYKHGKDCAAAIRARGNT